MQRSEMLRNGEVWVRVQRKTARRLFDIEKKDIFFMPCKANPRSPWGLGLIYSAKNNCHTCFEQICDEFEYNNCYTAELGRRATFYARKEEV